MKIPLDMMAGAIHKTKQDGDLVVVKYINSNEVKVRFVETNFEVFARSVEIRNGEIKDRLKPSVFGVGFLGDGDYRSRENGAISCEYQAWKGMLKRCYDDKYHKRNTSYADCEVCEEWQDFQKFSRWYNETHPGGDVQLDKDGIVSGNKVYSPETCQWVSAQENIEISHAKRYRFVNPGGELIEVCNLSKFCRDIGLIQQSMCKVHNGKQKHHKGWTKA